MSKSDRGSMVPDSPDRRRTAPPLENAHLILFWLALAAYGAEAGFRFAGVAPSSPWRSPLFPGVLLHAAFLGIRWVLSGHAPMAGLFESLTVFSFCCAVAGLLLCRSEETAAAWKPLSVLVLLPQADGSPSAVVVRPRGGGGEAVLWVAAWVMPAERCSAARARDSSAVSRCAVRD